MKYIIFILLVFFGLIAKAQLPASTFMSRDFNGNTKADWIILDSPMVNFVGTATFNARYAGTQFVKIGGGDTAFYFGAGGTLWFRTLLDRDTISLSNRINLRLNISDTTSKWWGIGKRWVDTLYRVNDSTIGFTINDGSQQTFQILGRSASGGGAGTVTSVGLSLPSAFTVTGSPITTSGTFNISGAGTTAEYIRGNGTLATTDTGMIPNFHLKVRSLFSVTSPLTYNSTTGIFGVGDANTAGTKGVATFASSAFTDNGSGLINLADVTTAGTCINCDITFDAKGRATSYASGTPPQFVNASGAGDTLSISDTLKRLNNGYGILHAVTANNITHSVDTSSSNSLVTQYDLSRAANISNASLTADGNYTQNWNNKQWYVDSIAGSLLMRGGGIGSTGTRRKEFRINWGGSAFGDQMDAFNMMASIQKADLSADSLRLGLISGGTGVLSMGAYDVANSANNTFISYSLPGGLININARDSIWIKGAVPAATADSILGVTFRSANGTSKIVKIPLSAALGGVSLNNIGTGYRWLATTSGNFKSVTASNTIGWDSTSTANTLTAKADTSVLATQYDLTQIITGDTTLVGASNGFTDAEQEGNNQTYKWSLISNNARFQWYDGVSSAEYKDTLIMFGGWNASVSYDSVFQSADNGATWTFRSLLPYAVHTPAVINSSDGWTYVVGGDYLNNNTQRATVYRTKDFRTYETRTTTSPFGDRVLHAGVEFNGDLYVGGGQNFSLNAADGLYGDLYKSTDGGATWTLFSSSFPGGKNISGCFKVFNGRMYIVSGGIYDNNPSNKTFNRSVFSSVNGLQWITQDSIPYQGMQYPNLFIWDGKLWLSGGFGGTSVANIDSTAYMDKSGFWRGYKPDIKAAASHAAAMYVFKDRAYQILGNTVNQVWRLERSVDIFYDYRPIVRTGIAFDTIRRNSNGYNIDAYSSTTINENRYINSDATNFEQWTGSRYQLLNNGVLTWEFPANGQFYAKTLLASNSSTTFYTGTYYSTALQTTQNFPGIALSGASNRLVIGLDGSLFGFRKENGGTDNGIRFKHDIANGKTVIAQNTTADYDVAIQSSAALAVLSTLSGFLPPVMTATQKNAIGSPATGLQVFDTDSARASIYNGSAWKMVAWTSDITAATNIYNGDGTLLADRNVASGGFTLRLSGVNNSDTLMSIVNTGTSSVGLFSLGSLFGVDAQSTNVGLRAFGTSTGLTATGDNSEGAIIKSNTIRGITIQSVPASTNTVQEVARFERGSTGGPGGDGIGGSAEFYNKLSDNSSNVSNQIISKWTTATVGSRFSQLKITGVNNTATGDILTIDGDGSFTTYGKRIIGTTTSSAGTLTLGNSEAYIFNGTTTTWTLPAVSGTTGTIYYIKNAASGSITLNAAAAANEIYSTSAVNTYEITAGSAIILISNNTYWTVN